MFTKTLFQSQKTGANFLCSKKRGILAWEQGTGKTIISLASTEKLLELDLIQTALIIVPSAITWQWEDKIKEFTDSEATLIHAKSKLRGSYETTTPYTITSYNLFRRDYHAVVARPWDLVICDEAQEFKNNKSKISKLLKAFNVEVQPTYRWALTGTVISNKLEELYSIMYWVDRDFFPSWDVFEERHLVRNIKTNQIMRYKGLQGIHASLPRRLSRKTQQDIGDMPELVPNFHYIEKEKELKDAENSLLNSLDSLADLVVSGEGNLPPSTRAETSRAFHAVRELLASPSKLKYAVGLTHAILEENPANRVVLFSFFKQPLHTLADTFSEIAIPAFTFTGDQSTDAKRDSVKAFESQSSVLLCSNAGARGLDLPFANYLIHLDVPFSYEVVDQRNKRITRISSSFKTVKANYLVVKNSIEEYYLKQLKAKKMLSDAVYTGNTDTVTMRAQSLRKFLDDKR